MLYNVPHAAGSPAILALVTKDPDAPPPISGARWLLYTDPSIYEISAPGDDYASYRQTNYIHWTVQVEVDLLPGTPWHELLTARSEPGKPGDPIGLSVTLMTGPDVSLNGRGIIFKTEWLSAPPGDGKPGSMRLTILRTGALTFPQPKPLTGDGTPEVGAPENGEEIINPVDKV